jgi:two-component system cell cycle response regulator CtrA
MRVLLVEDDLTAARGVSLMLKSSGAVVDHTDTGEEALELTRHYEYDIVLLDIMLPDIEGYEVVRRMRVARNDTPVLILSGLARPQAKVKGLGMGADDYITKPFDRAELLARMQAIVRRCKGFSQPALRVGPLELNLDSREVLVDGKVVHLTGKEYAILELLVLRKGMVLTKEAFLNHLYGGMDEPEMKIIDVFICKLRKKLVQAGADNLIGTVWGRGYMVREPNSDPMAMPIDAMPGETMPDRPMPGGPVPGGPLADEVRPGGAMPGGSLAAAALTDEAMADEQLLLARSAA